MVKEFVKSEKTDESNTKLKNGFISNHKTKIHYLNFGEEDQMEISGYTFNNVKALVTWCCYILTIGLVRLVFHWYPQWQLYATHSPCSLLKAQKVLIVDNYKGKFKSYFVKKVETLTGSDNNAAAVGINGLIFKDNEDDTLLTVYLCDGTRKKMREARVVQCKKLTYVWNDEKDKFMKLSGLDKGITNQEFHTYKGYTKREQTLKRITYGPNTINVPVQSILTLLVLEALTPFYIFQLFSLIVWLAEFYYYYAVAIIIMSVFGISTSIVQTRKNQKNLKGTVHLTDKITVCRGSTTTFEEIPTTDLVPGDVIVIPSHGCEMHCDAVLLNGNCIVNESMLTGESVPVTKTSLPNDQKPYNLKDHSNHTLFSGTRVIQTRYYGAESVVAVVTRTGYLTSKGQLVRSIMYPPPADFKFDQDSYKFIMILSFIALLGFIYTVFAKFSRNIRAWDVLIKALDLVTIAIPPALPAAMTVGKLYALNRLKKHQIFCINSRVINVSGSVDCVCFDKTGTLTEDGLDMWGIVPVANSQIQNPIREIDTNTYNNGEMLLFRGMLTCHSLTLIDQELCGDPLDVKMFESTGWQLEEPTLPDTSKYDLLVPTIVKSPSCSTENGNSFEIGIIQQYQFSSSLQRMSVICRRLGAEDFEVFTKGSPEMVISLSKPETVPGTIFEQLKIYTEQGYRVIGMATKTIRNVQFHKIPKLHREEVECDLEFVGLIVLENRLKPETEEVIKTLQNANMKIVMITGDNIQTAVSVARECGILLPGYRVLDVTTTKPSKTEEASIAFHEAGSTLARDSSSASVDIEGSCDYHFVMSGSVWSDVNQYFPDLIPKLITKGVVFARMTGLQKQQLIEELQILGYYVAMCGDGANDCGALKAAHVGISLSDAESSVASPFTSKNPNISCTTKVIEEGRAALVTSFGVFKMMLCYSLTEFGSCIILYAIDTNLTPLQFLFIDICLILNFATFFGKTKAYERLDKKTPMMSLLSLTPLASLVSFMVIVMAFQTFSYYLVQTYAWFKPFIFDPDHTTTYASYENYAVFTLSMFQYITMAVIFSRGKPYRKQIFTNYYLTASLVVMVAVCSYITLDPAGWIMDALELKVPPVYSGRWPILAMALVNFLVCYAVEDFLVEFVLHEKIRPRFEKVSKGYLKVQQEKGWPAVLLKKSEGGIDNKGFSGLETTTF